jgi:hypothetical protein
MPQRVKLATEMMSTDAGRHADQACWQTVPPLGCATTSDAALVNAAISSPDPVLPGSCRGRRASSLRIAPRSSRPKMWNEFLPISMPIAAIAFCAVAGMARPLSWRPWPALAGQERVRTIPLSDVADLKTGRCAVSRPRRWFARTAMGTHASASPKSNTPHS